MYFNTSKNCDISFPGYTSPIQQTSFELIHVIIQWAGNSPDFEQVRL